MARTLQVESINSSSTGLDLQTLNASRLFIKSDGNVGIGTTSPASKLHVVGTGGSLRMQNSIATSKYIQLRSDVTNSHLEHIGGPSDALRINNQAAGQIEFLTSNTERLRIDSSGNVGIGSTNPTSKLFINDTQNSVYSGSSLHTPIQTIFNSSTVDGSGTVLRLQNGDGSIVNLAAISAGDFQTQFAIQMRSAVGTYAERFRIDNTGNVGIGTTSPAYPLVVNSAVSTQIQIRAGNTNASVLLFGDTDSATIGRIQYDHGTDSMAMWANGAERLRIDSSGNVGIGTTSPIEQLQVSGTGRIHLGNGSVITDTTAGIYFHTFGETGYAIHRTTGAWTAPTYQQLRISFATGIVLDTGTAHHRSFVQVDGTGIRVATGNIGIGTTTKTLNHKLDVYCTDYTDCVRIAASGITSGIDFFDTSSGSLARKGIIYTNSEGIGILNSAAAWALRVNQGTTNVVIPTGSLTVGQDIITNANYGYGHVGLYAADKFQSVFAMGIPFTMKADGTSLSAGAGGNNFYGIAWSYGTAPSGAGGPGGQAANLSNHGALFVANGITQTAISSSIWCIGNITAYSDERVKTNWRNFDNNFVEKLAKVKSGIFDRTDVNEKENGLKTQVGVSAQSLKEVIPDAVTCNSEGMLSVSYGNAAMASCVELAKEILKLKEEIAKIKENK